MKSEWKSIVDVLRAHTASKPEALAYLFLVDGEKQEEKISYAELDSRAGQMAAYFSARLEKGDRVLVSLQNPIDFLTTFLGLIYAGLIAVPVSDIGSKGGLVRMLGQQKDCQAKLLVTSAKELALVKKRGADISGLNVVIFEDVALDGSGILPVEIAPDDVAFLQYTSGSTSKPKGVVVTHGNIMANEAMIKEAFEHDDRTVFGSWLPLFHDMGLIGGVLQPLYLGVPSYVMTPLHFLEKPVRWLEMISRYRVTTSGAPDFAYDLCAKVVGDGDKSHLDLSSWKVAFSGAEPVRTETLRDFYSSFSKCGFDQNALYPCYGLAESTLLVSGSKAGRGALVEQISRKALEEGRFDTGYETGHEKSRLEIVSVGMLREGNRVVIVNAKDMELVAEGGIGEIWVSGESVARGYWNHIEDGEYKAFGNRLSDYPEEQFLRTGDLGFVDKGELYVTGRIKDVLIVRGRNFYPADIEATAIQMGIIRRHGVCAAVDIGEDGDNNITLLIEVKKSQIEDADRMADEIRRCIQEFHELKIDTIVFVSGRLPRTTSGKIQRSLCAKQYKDGELKLFFESCLGGDDERSPDSGLAQKDMASFVISELKRFVGGKQDVESVPVSSLSLDSIDGTMLAYKISERFGVEVPSNFYLRDETVHVLCQGLLKEKQFASYIYKTEGQASVLQELFYVSSRNDSDRTTDHISLTIENKTDMDEGALRQVCETLMDRHPMLKCGLFLKDGTVWQKIHEKVNAPIKMWEYASEQEAQESVQQEKNIPFDLEKPPLFRLSLHKWSDGGILYLTVHHAIADYWSLCVLKDDLEKLLCGGLLDDAVEQGSYIEFSEYQRGLINSPRGEEVKQQWKEIFSFEPKFSRLPGRSDEKNLGVYRDQSIEISGELSRKIDLAAKSCGVSTAVFFLSAFQYFLKVLSGEDNVIVSVPFHGRVDSRWANTFGGFVNLIPFVEDMDCVASFNDLLLKTRERMAQHMEDHVFPFSAAQIRMPKRGSRTPVTQIGFNVYKNPLSASNIEKSESPHVFDMGGWDVDADIAALFSEMDGVWQGRLKFDLGCIDADSVSIMARQFHSLLECVAKDPFSALSPEFLLSQTERDRLLGELGAGEQKDLPHKSVSEILDGIIKDHANGTAIRQAGLELTYQELGCRINEFACYLKDKGIGRGDIVACRLPSGIGLVVSMLAIWRVGATYLPMDPAYPDERIEHILRDASPSLCLDEERWREFEAIRDQYVGRQGALAATGGGDVLYIIYTSGSTGRPKGVMIPQRGVVNLLAAQRIFGISSGERVLQFSSPGFDASIFEMLLALGVGATMVVPETRQMSGEELAGFFEAESIEHAVIPPTIVQLLPSGSGRSVITLIVAGEACPTSLIKEWAGRCALYNAYGPTEITIWATVERLLPNALPFIGRPICNAKAVILDENKRCLPEGAVGELWVGGSGVGKGYINLDVLSAERFCKIDELNDDDVWYKTGDKARWCGGSIEFLGRVDRQVKLRGVRIELGEIEEAFCSIVSVKKAHAMIWRGAGGEEQLVLCFVSDKSTDLDAVSLRTALSKILPSTMLPSQFISFETMPVTVHGKINEDSLVKMIAERQSQGRVGGAEQIEYWSPLAEDVAEIWRAILNIPSVSMEDDLFSLGAHSLNIMLIASMLEKKTGKSISPNFLMSNPQFSDLVKAIECLEEVQDCDDSCASEQSPQEFPMTATQQDVLFSVLMGKGEAYRIPLNIELEGKLDRKALREAVFDVVKRHVMLRAKGFLSEEGAKYIVSPEIGDVWSEKEVGALGIDGVVAEIRGKISAPFNVEFEEPFSGCLYHLEGDRYVLSIITNHLVFDGWSSYVLLGDLSRAYAARLDGEVPQWADSPSYLQATNLSDEEREKRLAYWERELKGAQLQTSLLADNEAVPEELNARVQSFPLPSQLVSLVKELARSNKTTLFSCMASVFAVMLGRNTGQNDVVFGTVNANRDGRKSQSVIGNMTEVLPVNVSLSEKDFLSLAKEIGETVFKGKENSGVSISEIANRISAPRGVDGISFPRVLFVDIAAEFKTLQLSGVLVSPMPQIAAKTKYDLIVSVDTDEENPTLTFEYDANKYQDARIARLADQYIVLMQSSREVGSVTSLPCLSEAEQDILFHQFNKEPSPYDWNGPLHVLFEKKVLECGDAVALVYEGREVSYADLNDLAEDVATAIVRSGIENSAPVGVASYPCVEMFAAILGIMKAGGSYVPMDPDLPDQRLKYYAETTRMKMLVCVGDNAGRWKDMGIPHVLSFDSIQGMDGKRRDVSVVPDQEDTAYIIFTSGSTGNPKGVMNTHKGIVNRLLWMQEQFGLEKEERVLFKTSFTFDVSVWEIFWPLIVGASVVISRRGGNLDPDYLAKLIFEENVTTVHFVPSVLSSFLSFHESFELNSLRRIICSGDELTTEIRDHVFRKLNVELYNLYGPTEAAIDVSCWHCTGEEKAVIPIGKPIRNCALHVLDVHKHIVPIGAVGELYISGAGLAKGYINNTQLTAEKFIDAPFEGFGNRFYSTGDLARWTEQGVVEFFGRIDNQVKIRGFRVEPDEIAAILLRTLDISEAVVLAKGQGEDKVLAAYCVIDPAKLPPIAEVRALLSKKLPAYMLPAHIVAMESFPRLPSGKIDRKALAQMQVDHERMDDVVAPSSKTEERVLTIWKELLSNECIGIDDNFFDVGGHSLLVMRLGQRLSKEMNVEVPITSFFQFPTVRSFSAMLENGQANESDPAQISLAKEKRLAGRARAGEIRKRRMCSTKIKE